MKIFFDTEFTGLHKDTMLISIGCVSEDNRQFYAEFNDYDRTQCDDWIESRVIPNLRFNNPKDRNHYGVSSHGKSRDSILKNYSVELVGDKKKISDEFTTWLSQFDSVEFISDCSHYDFVLLIDLFGTAFDLPKQVCPACHDINQDIAKYYGVTDAEAFDISREQIIGTKDDTDKKHNALFDAEVIRDIYNIIFE